MHSWNVFCERIAWYLDSRKDEKQGPDIARHKLHFRVVELDRNLNPDSDPDQPASHPG